jgi:hypothetical protein
MPFGLKNAGATYQRMMQNFLGNQIGRNIQVYIDDVVITTRKEESLIMDLRETFDNPLLLYIAATYQVVSTVLVVEQSEEGKAHEVQRPVYFLSEVLSPSKQRYLLYQKIAYSMFTTPRKLRQYFAVHPIIVVNKAPLSNILNNPEAT